MEINWTLLSYLVMGYFAIAGLTRGWWKEAVSTVVLTGLVFLLQNPTTAEMLVEQINAAIAGIWSFLPDSVTPIIDQGLQFAVAVDTGGGPLRFDPSDPGTWIILLILLVGASVLATRGLFGNRPTGLGRALGAGLGVFNGFLIMNLLREYLDGRALPGSQPLPQMADMTVVSSSAFGPPAEGVTLQFSQLPNFTILDSVIPWLSIGIGVFLLVSLLKTRVNVATGNKGAKISSKLPPFYTPPAKPLARRPIVLEERL